MAVPFKEDFVETQENILSYYYLCQQKKNIFTKNFEQAQSVEERHYWIKQLNKNELELESLKMLLSDYRPQQIPEIQDHPPRYRL